MASLTVPIKYQPGLRALSEITKDSLNELVDFLQGITPPLDIRAEAISPLAMEHIKSIPGPELRKIVRTLIALYSVRASADVSLEEFVDDVSRAMAKATRKEPQSSVYVEGEFKTRLRRLLGFPALNAASKAVYLQHEHERIFCDARIITDARPVYLGAASDPPESAVITHTLRVAYHEGGQLKAVYFALDGDDLTKLQGILDRAHQKAKSLRATLDRAGVKFIFP